ncbi:MAG: asparaginase [Actinomycetota bacterium]|nr:asparaginase [Actinomycetota bacterium]
MNTGLDAPVPLVRIERGGEVESRHSGWWVIVEPTGEVVAGGGDPATPVFARSASKPLQALAMLTSGAADAHDVTDEEVALACASHSGQERHVALVETWLRRLGLTGADLRCGPQPRPWVRAGSETAVHNNCSGKHAGFLTLSLHLDQAPADYLDPVGAGQRAVRAHLAHATGTPDGDLVVAVDGCSAPTYRLPLRALATGLARLVAPPEGGPDAAASRRVVGAMTAHPELVGGTNGRLCTEIMRAAGGRLVAKTGAEGVFVVAHRRDGRALAVKVADGAHRGHEVFLVALLDALGWLDGDGAAAVEDWRAGTIRNWAGLVTGRRVMEPGALDAVG